MGADVVGVERCGPVEVGDGPVHVAHREAVFSPVVHRLEEPRTEADGFIEAVGCFVIRSFVVERDALAHPGIDECGTQFQRLVIVGQGGLRVVGERDAVVSHAVVFAGILLQAGAQGVHVVFQAYVFCAQAVDYPQLTAYEPLDEGLLDVVACVYGAEKCVEERVEVAVVEGPDGLHVEHVGLCLAEGAVDGLPVVELLGEADYLGTDEDVAARDGLAECDAVERGAPAEGDIGLSAGEDASREVDVHAAEREPLAFVYGDGPGQPERELGECAEFFLFDAFFLFIIGIADVAPHFAAHVIFPSVVGDDIDDAAFFIQSGHYADGAVHPAFVRVVLDENDLCSGFQLQFEGRREAVGRELPFDFSREDDGVAFEFGQAFVVDVVDLVASGGQCDAHVVGLLVTGIYTGVEQLQVGDAGRVRADAVEHADKHRVALPVDLVQLDAHQFHLAKDIG